MGRARAGHCWGAFACAKAVADDMCVPVTSITAMWRKPLFLSVFS